LQGNTGRRREGVLALGRRSPLGAQNGIPPRNREKRRKLPGKRLPNGEGQRKSRKTSRAGHDQQPKWEIPDQLARIHYGGSLPAASIPVHPTTMSNENKQTELPISDPKVQPKTVGEADKSDWSVRLKPKKTFQTLVSGAVMVTRPELEIIDTPDFQRLRRVRQLGSSCMVYPTAIHTRFDHSLGTLEMVEQMMQCIMRNEHSEQHEKEITPRQRAMARIYALVHDITHVPFGHTIEDELGILARHDENEPRIMNFLGPDSPVGKIIIDWFGKEFHADLLRIYRWDDKLTTWDGSPDDIFIHDLVSNTVCADLLDYLRRDDHYCNLGVGMSYPFLNYLYLGAENHAVKSLETGKETTITPRRVFVRLWKTQKGQPRRDVLSDLCRLLEARYLVAERVYFHHAKVIAGAMLARAIQEAAEAKQIDEKKMWEHSDDTLVYELMKLEKKAPLAAKLARAYWDRRLHKCAFEYRDEDIEKTQADDHREAWMNAHVRPRLGTAQQRRAFENHLADVLMVEPGDVLIYFPDERMNMKQAQMRVLWKGQQIPFKDVDDPVTKPRLKAVLDAHERLWSIRVLVSPSLSPEKRSLLKDLCDLELMTGTAEAVQLRQAAYEKIVWQHLDHDKDGSAIPPAEAHKKVQAAAAVLCQAAKDTRESFGDRVRAVISEQFGIKGK